MIMRLLCVLLLAVLSTACASLNSVSYTNIPADRSHPVEEEASSWSIFGIYFSNDFVDEVHDGLKSKCPGGRITGIATKYESRLYVFITKRHIEAHGFCEQPAAAAPPPAVAP